MTLEERLTRTAKGIAIWHQEGVRFRMATELWKAMKSAKIGKRDLAKRMGITLANLKEILCGEGSLNDTVQVMAYCGKVFVIGSEPLNERMLKVMQPVPPGGEE